MVSKFYVRYRYSPGRQQAVEEAAGLSVSLLYDYLPTILAAEIQSQLYPALGHGKCTLWGSKLQCIRSLCRCTFLAGISKRSLCIVLGQDVVDYSYAVQRLVMFYGSEKFQQDLRKVVSRRCRHDTDRLSRNARLQID